MALKRSNCLQFSFSQTVDNWNNRLWRAGRAVFGHGPRTFQAVGRGFR